MSDHRPVATVAAVAAYLAVDRSTVYRLIDNHELEAHGIGKRGRRVYWDSVYAYQQRSAVAANPCAEVIAHPVRRRPVHHNHQAALEKLRAAGLRSVA